MGKLDCRKIFIDIILDSLKKSIISGSSDEAAIFKVLDSSMLYIFSFLSPEIINFFVLFISAILIPIVTQNELKLLQHYKNPLDNWGNIFNEDERAGICGLVYGKSCKILPMFQDYLRFVQLVLRIKKFDLFNDMSWWNELDKLSEISNSEIYSVAFCEMKRKLDILRFLQGYCLDKKLLMQIMTSREILQPMIDSDFKISLENYVELKVLLEKNDEYLRKQVPSVTFDSEFDKLNECLVIKLYLDIIQSSDPSQEFINEHTNEILKLLKLITKGDILLKILLNVFNMTHLRHEQFERTKIVRYGYEVSSTNNMSKLKYLKNDLVCCQKSLKEILESMRTFLLCFDQSDIYRDCDRDMKSKFDEVLRYIETVLWKFKIVAVKNTKNEFKFGIVSCHNYSAFLESENIHRIQYSSSENEIMGQKRKMLTKKKLRKCKKSTFRNTSDSDDESSQENSITKNVNFDHRLTTNGNNIVNLPTMEPEKLLNLSVMKCDYVIAERIIKDFELQDSKEVKQSKFLMNFKKARDELMRISTEFSDYCEYTKDNKLSNGVDEIRILTEKGLIRQKFFRTLKDFISHNRLNINGKCEHRSSLELALNAAAVMFFFLSIPCVYELTHDFYKYILKTFKSDDWKCQIFLIDLMEIFTICSNEDIETNIVEILRTDTFILDPEKFKHEIVMRKRLIEIWNEENSLKEIEKTHIASKLFEKLECRENPVARNLVNYVRYLKSIVKQVSGNELNFDDIAKVDPQDLLAKIIFDLQNNPKMIDTVVNNSHMELLEYVAVVGDTTCEIKFVEDEKLLTLFQLKEFSGGSNTIELNLDVKNARIYNIHKLDSLYYLKNRNFFEIKKIVNLSSLYGGNRVLTALCYDHIDIKMLLRKILESKKIHEKLELLCSLSKQQWMKNEKQFDEIHDSYVEMIINYSRNFEAKLERLQQIRGIRKYYLQLIRLINDIEDQNLVTKLLERCTKYSDELEPHQLENVEDWMKKVKVYSEISQMIGKSSTWLCQKKEAEKDPYPIIYRLLMENLKFSLCSEFIQICKIDFGHENFIKMWIEALNKQDSNKSLIQLIDILGKRSPLDVAKLLVDCLSSIEKLNSLKEIINYLEHYVKLLPSEHRIRFQKFKISTRICELLDECDEYIHLCAYPLLIIEQLLMNLKLDKLKLVINEVRKVLSVDDYCFACDKSCNEMYQVRQVICCDLDTFHTDIIITNECIDLMLKCYATKAIDFEIIETPSSNGTLTTESCHSNFQMPLEIPAKHSWIPDSEAKLCMCCQKQRFSLFARRHHCRRCGRVVCDSCSKYRVRLTEVYHDLCVRVCLDCNLWMTMKHDGETTTDASSKIPFKRKDNLWKLTAIDATGKRSI